MLELLKAQSLWEDENTWKPYGDMENNYSIVNSQQETAEAALAELLVNAADANLLKRCKIEGIDPTDTNSAPSNIDDALYRYYNLGPSRFVDLSVSERAKLGDRTSGIFATGSRKDPCYGIYDWGEGQLPEQFADTFLALKKSNKDRIHFVQGKFNQGSTGVFQYCGKHGFKLIVSSKHPKLKNGAAQRWGFTLTRKNPPTEHNGRKSSCVEYLAPSGRIMEFERGSLNVIPNQNCEAYAEPLSHGTFVKLYSYKIGSKYSTAAQREFFNRLSNLLVNPILPTRVFECRPYFTRRSTTIVGLHTRLHDDRRDNVEPDFPIGGKIRTSLGEFDYQVFVLKEGVDNRPFSPDAGVLFLLNGQTHGTLPRSFFTKKSNNLSYLKDHLVIIIDCSKLSYQQLENMFQTSRDRIKRSDETQALETKLSEILSQNSKLRELSAARRLARMDREIQDDPTAQKVYERIVETSPVLTDLLVKGRRISNVVPPSPPDPKDSQLKLHPTFFEEVKATSCQQPKRCQIGKVAKLDFRTDAPNDYLVRDKDPGVLSVRNMDGSDYDGFVSIVPNNGIWTLRIEFNENCQVGDKEILEVSVFDRTMIEPLVATTHLEIVEAREASPSPPSPKKSATLPPITEVRRDEWGQHSFDECSALKIVGHEDRYDFYVNLDNKFLQTEIRASNQLGSKVLEHRFKLGLFLLTLPYISEELKKSAQLDESPEGLEDQVERMTRSAGQVILPIIEGLSTIELEGLKD